MRIKHVFRVLGFAFLGAALLTGAVAGAAPNIPTSSTDRVRTTTASVNLSTSGGVYVTVLSFNVPAGSWVLSMEAALVNFGPSDYTRCALFAGGTQITGTGTTTMLGNADLPGGQGPGVYVANLADIGKYTSSVSFTASIRCLHDHDTPGGNAPPYVDPGATIWAHKSTSLS